MLYCILTKNPSLMSTHTKAAPERLLSMIREVLGASMGIKIRALLLLEQGQR
jgi:hypothetical protein